MIELNDGDSFSLASPIYKESVPITLGVEVSSGSANIALKRAGQADLQDADYTFTENKVKVLELTFGAVYTVSITAGNKIHISTAGGLVNVIPSA